MCFEVCAKGGTRDAQPYSSARASVKHGAAATLLAKSGRFAARRICAAVELAQECAGAGYNRRPACDASPKTTTANDPNGTSMSKLLQTTIPGSLPKPVWLAEPKQLWAPW